MHSSHLDPENFHRIRASENHADRVKKIEAKEETNTSSSAHTSVWSIAATTVTIAKSMMDWIPSFFFPNNPAKGPILPFLKFSYWSGFFLQWVSPVALTMGWLNTFDSINRFANAKNRNYEAYLDLFVSGVTSVTSTILFFVGGAKIGILLTLGVFALNAVYGVVNCLKNIGYALFADATAARKEYLINAGKQLLSIATHSLGFAVIFLLGIKTEGAILATIGNLYKQAVNYLAALTFVSLAGMAADSAKSTLSTLANFFYHPKKTLSETFHSLRNDFRENKVQALRSILLFPVRVATIPVQLVLFGIFKLAESVMNYFKPIKNQEKTTSDDETDIYGQIEDSTPSETRITNRLSIDIQRYEKEYGNIANAPTDIQGKWILRDELLKNRYCWDNIDRVATEISGAYKGTYDSFWKRKGGTEEIVEEVYQYHKRFSL